VIEQIRGTWIARDFETEEANRKHLRNAIDRIPADLREKFLSVIDWAERTEQWSDVIIEGSAKDAVRHIAEIMFLEAQILVLVRAIRSTKDLASIRALRIVTRETIERIQEHACQREVEK
jgi:hypothetical protein